MYTLRLLIAEPLPLNEGLMDAVELRVPEGMLNPRFHADAARCPAVCAGNVETSQRVVDTLVRALGIAACGQGTMNNVIFGNDRFGYYETVCGGAGAGPGAAGAAAWAARGAGGRPPSDRASSMLLCSCGMKGASGEVSCTSLSQWRTAVG